MLHTRIVRATAVAALALIAACGSGKTGSTSGRKTFRIALIAKSSSNPVFLYARTGAEAAAAELSKTDSVDITIDWLTPPDEDGTVQAQRIAEAVNAGDNAIILSASDAGKVTGAINDAVARGVPVMMFDSDAPESKRFAFYGADDLALGHQVMSELAAQMNDKGKVAILAGNQNAPNLQKRVQGVREEAAKYPGITILGVFNHAETPQDAAAEVLRASDANHDIQGWAMIGGWALFTKALLDDLDPRKVKIVSVDALGPELPYVAKGLAPVLLAQPCYMWGDVSVRTVVDHVLLHKQVPEFVPMQLERVTRDNLGEWARKLKTWGATDVDSVYLTMNK